MSTDANDNLVLRHLQELRKEMGEGFADVRREMKEFRSEVDERFVKVDYVLKDVHGLVSKSLTELVANAAWRQDIERKLATYATRITELEAEVSRLKHP